MVKFSTVEEVGLVKRVEGAFATVAVPKKSACEGCSLKYANLNNRLWRYRR
jgi:hypothetical protein